MRRPASKPPELPGYTPVRLLGSGGFADVFLYDQKLPKRRVAVKVLLTEEVTVASRAAFVAEANLMAQLSAHPYIVTIYQADVSTDGRPYIVMEYCPGASLAERYKREKFDVSDALRTGVRLSSAVATAHSAGILHRDIKPANVLTNDYGWPALTDFGISSAVDDGLLPVHTSTLADALSDAGAGATGQSTGQIGMSVPWSPPEMFGDNPQPDVRSDVFSLAATVYTILAGQTPFEVRGRSNGTLDLIGRIERGIVTRMPRDDVPTSLLAVLDKGMATDRSARFATAVDFARALQRVELELGYSPTAIDVPNLSVAPEQRDDEPGSEDETRVRSVATIAVQADGPAEATRVRQPTSITQAPERATLPFNTDPINTDPIERTQVRRRLTEPEASGVASGANTDSATALPNEEQAPTRRRGLVIGIILAAIVLVGGGMAALLVLPGLSGVPQPNYSQPSSGGGVIKVDTVPKAEAVSSSANADGTSVTFTWSNPAPKRGDTFLWSPSETPDRNTAVIGPTVTVTGVTPQSRVCINVVVLRAGKTSPNVLTMCNP